MFLKWTDELLKDPGQTWRGIESGKGLFRQALRAALAIILFSGAFGMAVGSYVGGRQILITGYKVPVLMLSTFGICVIVMYILNAIVARRLSFVQVVCVGIVSISITAVILGAFAPVIFLFSRTLRFRYYVHYGFLVLLCTAMVAFAGSVSIWYLYRAFKLLKYPRGARILVIACWMLVYQFVGAQMTFILRPFVGSSADTVRFEGNFYEAVPLLIKNIITQLSGG
jgi:hypothetical protein